MLIQLHSNFISLKNEIKCVIQHRRTLPDMVSLTAGLEPTTYLLTANCSTD
jgi:hypothetical protein